MRGGQQEHRDVEFGGDAALQFGRDDAAEVERDDGQLGTAGFEDEHLGHERIVSAIGGAATAVGVAVHGHQGGRRDLNVGDTGTELGAGIGRGEKREARSGRGSGSCSRHRIAAAGALYWPGEANWLGMAAVLVALCARAEDWPQWRGPESRGSLERKRAAYGVERDEEHCWKAKLAGTGVSSPIVTDIFVIVTVGRHCGWRRRSATGARRPGAGGAENAIWAVPSPDGKVRLAVEVFLRSDGKRQWKYETEAVGAQSDLHEKHNLATPTPVTDGERVYVWFGDGQVVALDGEGERGVEAEPGARRSAV